MIAAEHDPAARPSGRPRSVEADRAIVDAVIEEFVEHGWDGLTVEGVAVRAGVGKATIYRRYPSKVDLLTAAAEVLTEDKDPIPDTGTLAGDIRALGRSYVRMLTRSRLGRALPAMVTALTRSPDLARAHKRSVSEHRSRVAALLDRAVERGEIRSGTDLELFVDMLFGPLFYRAFVARRPVDAREIDALTDRLMTAFA